MSTIRISIFFIFLLSGTCIAQPDSEQIRQKRAVTPLKSNNTDTIEDFDFVNGYLNVFVYGGTGTVPFSTRSASNSLVYFRKDSSLFSGVLLSWENYYRKYPDYPTVVVQKFDKGKVVKNETYVLVKDGKAFKTLFPFYSYLPAEDRNARLLRYSDDFGTVEFYPNGDTLCKRSKTMSVYFYPNRDTMSFDQHLHLDSVTISRYFFRNERGKTTSFSFEKEYLDKSNRMYRYELNDRGDTIVCEHRINDLLDGIVIQNLKTMDSMLVIRTKWENGTLTDILKDNVLYMNDRCKLIGKAEFIREYSHFQFGPLYTELKGESGRTYNLIAYSYGVSDVKVYSALAKYKQKPVKDRY